MVEARIQDLLLALYGPTIAESTARRVQTLLEEYDRKIPAARRVGWNERDAILITYADQVQQDGVAPLASLADFCDTHLRGVISGVHILPFFPWSSDDGFAIVDYETVAPGYGSWSDVRKLGERFRLMFDAVINHVSAESAWFQGFLGGVPEFRDFFIEVQGQADLAQVVRPRALPLLTEIRAEGRIRRLWTTFSADQIDLNYHDPDVLLKVIEVLLYYARQGAEFIRLDAIAYLWKEPGTSCINLPQTHWIVQLLRAVLDEVAPHVMLITETNVPNRENLSYFGNGFNEAQLVYNFPLPPLVLHAMQTANASALSNWAGSLKLPSGPVTFLNFLASHDGIGLNPARGVLPESEILELAQRVETAGGYVSEKTNSDGTRSPYELNINYLDALDAAQPASSPDMRIERFLTAHAILLAFMGLPAIYFHSMFGSTGWPEGVAQTHQYRSINRQKLSRVELETALADEGSVRRAIFRGLRHLLMVRGGDPCFSPSARQTVLAGPDSVFAVVRSTADGAHHVLCIHNVSQNTEQIRLNLAGTSLARVGRFRDLIRGRQIRGAEMLSMTMAPYESVWLTG